MKRLSFSANLSILFTELPLLSRPAAAAAVGFDAIELWWPFTSPDPPDGELDGLANAIGDAGVRLVALNFDAGDLASGDRGLVSLPREGQRFAENVECAVGFAATQGTLVLNALYGNRVDYSTPEEQDSVAMERIALAADAAASTGAVVVMEPQNHVDSPRYPIRTMREAVSIVKALATGSHSNVGVLCDLYHLAMEGANLAKEVRDHHQHISHVQIADAPGRHEPGTGSVDFEAALGCLLDTSYQGFVGCEYRPSGASQDSFGWMQRFA